MMRKSWRDAEDNDDGPASDTLDRATAFEPSRRWFNQSMLAGLAVAALPAVGLSLESPGAFVPFDIKYAPSVLVRISGSQSFTVTVLTTDGRELERHDSVTGRSIHRLRSDHFAITRINAPASV